MALTRTGRGTLGDILVRLGVVTPEQVEEACGRAAREQIDLLTALSEKGFAKEEQLLKAISVSQRIPYFTTFEGLLDPEAARLIPQRMARRLLVLPLRRTEKGLLLGMVNVVDIVAIDTVGAHTGLRVFPVLTTRRNLFETIDSVYGEEVVGQPEEPKAGEAALPSLPEGPMRQAGQVKIVPRDVDVSAARYNPTDTSVIEIVDGMIAEGVANGASDIHLEPTVSTLRMRLRIDGVLYERRAYLKDIEPAIVARIKILSRLDITETRLPQDGHISVDYGGRGIDLRVSTLPTIYGEKVVVRVLDQMTSRRTLADLGMPPDVAESYQKIIRSPMGMVLVTGPTGSGKTTTLYAAINEINIPERNIITLEDPVEYRIAGINQVETNAHIGLTFASGLRSILRQDPNVILVGEIRDLETAEIAIQASITGHLVLSTLHTKDAIGTISRLLNMKVEPFLLSAALSGVMAQRLIRVLCDKCKKPQMPLAHEASRLGAPLKEPGPFFGPSPQGCEACLGLGYVGRRGIYEWLPVAREIRGLISSESGEDQIKQAARASGAKSLQEAGLDLVYKGATSLSEVVRVTYEEEADIAES